MLAVLRTRIAAGRVIHQGSIEQTCALLREALAKAERGVVDEHLCERAWIAARDANMTALLAFVCGVRFPPELYREVIRLLG